LDDDSRIIVANLGSVTTGIQVDAVSEVLTVPKSAIEAPPQVISTAEANQLRGVAKLDEGKRLVILLDLGQILSISDVHKLAKIAASAENERGTEELVLKQSLDEEQVVSFRLDNEEFGVDIHQVQEIIWLPEITKVPRAPHFVEGIVNLRGSVLPVIDMRKRFGLAPTPTTDSTSIVVVDIEGRKTGVIVDSVSEVIRVSRSAIEPPPPVVAGVDAGFVRGVGKLQNGQRMLIVLDLARVLAVETAA
jgi:purine-binding chemotaxis protein CheW